MKKILFCFCVFCLLGMTKTFAQSGFVENQYYQCQYRINDAPVSEAEREYDAFGRYLGVFQIWQKAEWHNESGGEYIYVWAGNQWQSQWYSGTYYWFT